MIRKRQQHPINKKMQIKSNEFVVLKCIELGGFSVVPLVFLAISILMFGKEYKKQGVIKRYLYRAMVKCMKAKEA